MNLSTQAYVHANGVTYPKNSLYNAVVFVCEGHPEWRSAMIDCGGKNYQQDDIERIVRGPAFADYRARLLAIGKTRD